MSRVISIILIILSIVLFSFGFFFMTSASLPQISVLVTDDCPGFMEKRENQYLGFEYDLIRKIEYKLIQGKKIKKFNFQSDSFESIISKIGSGQADIGVGCFSYTKERSNLVGFSPAHSQSRTIMIIDYNKKGKASNLGVQKNYAFMKEINDYAAQNDIKIVLFESLDFMRDAFVSGDIDSCIVDSIIASNFSPDKRNTVKNINNTSTTIHYILNPKNPEFNKVFNAVMADSLNEIHNKIAKPEEKQKTQELEVSKSVKTTVEKTEVKSSSDTSPKTSKTVKTEVKSSSTSSKTEIKKKGN